VLIQKNNKSKHPDSPDFLNPMKVLSFDESNNPKKHPYKNLKLFLHL